MRNTVARNTIKASPNVLAYHRKCVERIGTKLDIKNPKEWKKVSQGDFSHFGGQFLLDRYGTLRNTLYTLYPDARMSIEENPNLNLSIDASMKPFKALDTIAKSLEVKTLGDWVSVTGLQVRKIGGSALLAQYGGSLQSALRSVYSQYEYVHNMHDRKRCLLRALSREGRANGIEEIHDWYNIPYDELQDTLIILDDGESVTLKEALCEVYYDKKWDMTKFPGYWNNDHVQLKAMDRIAEALGVMVMDDWHKVTTSLFLDAGGQEMLSICQGEMPSVLGKVYSGYKWNWIERINNFKSTKDPSLFYPDYWKDVKKQMEHIEDISEKDNIKTLNEWSKVSNEKILKKISGILKMYNNSLQNMFCTLYPDAIEHIGWSKKRTWKAPSHVVTFLKKAEKKLNILDAEQWYRVSAPQLQQIGGGGFMPYFPWALETMYPDNEWTWHKFKAGFKKSNQSWLLACVKKIFDTLEVEEEQVIGVLHATGAPLVVDIFIPFYNIAIEYQGEHHYHDALPHAASTLVHKARDIEKSQACKDQGFTLVPIPYWWQGDIDSVASTIKHYAPEIEMDFDSKTKPLLGTSSPVQQQGEDTIRQSMMAPIASR